MSEANEGLTNEIENSSDLESTEEVESLELTDTSNESDVPMTKKVSDRINKVREDAIAKEQEKFNEMQKSYEKQINDFKAKIREYKANEEGITVDELIAREQSEKEKNDSLVENDPRYQALLQKDFERQKADTLNAIQKAFPEENLEDIDNLPVDFYKMLQAGVDPTKAYRASVIMDRKETPPSSGSVKTNESVDKEMLYTQEQVASMTQEEVHEHWNEITKSMKNW